MLFDNPEVRIVSVDFMEIAPEDAVLSGLRNSAFQMEAGRVLESPSKDKRSVKVMTSSGPILRPIQKLCLLECSDEK